jgi:hypothetical protein
MNEWLKLPGLFHRHEFEQVIVVDGEHEYRFEAADHDDSGQELVAIYCRSRRPHRTSADVDVPRQLHGQAPARAPEGGLA